MVLLCVPANSSQIVFWTVNNSYPPLNLSPSDVVRSSTSSTLPRQIFPKMKSAPVLHHSTKPPKKLSKHSVFVLNTVVENLLVSLWFMILKQTSRNLKYLFSLRCFVLTFSNTIEKFVLVFRVRLRNLLDNNGNRGRIGVRSLGGPIKRRPLVWIRRARNRCCIHCCGSHLFMSFIL